MAGSKAQDGTAWQGLPAAGRDDIGVMLNRLHQIRNGMRTENGRAVRSVLVPQRTRRGVKAVVPLTGGIQQRLRILSGCIGRCRREKGDREHRYDTKPLH